MLDFGKGDFSALPSLGYGKSHFPEYWDALLGDPRAGASGAQVRQRSISKIQRHILRVSCRRCERIVEIQTVDTVRLYGGKAIWKDVARRLLDDTCQQRTGRDVLVTDASPRSIKSGQTDAKLLAKLHKAGVAIHSREGLHSKVMLIGKYAVVGSANMSGSGLTEAAVLSDEPTIRSGVASFIAQLSTKKSRLDGEDIAALCKIEVVRTGWPKGMPKKPIRIPRLGNATWIVGVYDLKRDPAEDEQKRIDRATSDINERLGAAAEEYDWIRWGKKGRFAKECRVGDTLIHVYNPKSGRGRTITRRRAVCSSEPSRTGSGYISARRPETSTKLTGLGFSGYFARPTIRAKFNRAACRDWSPRWPAPSTANGRG